MAGPKYASGKYAIAECDVCGFRYKLRELRKLVIKTKVVAIKACPTCWVPDQPQLQLGMYPVFDPQAVREPRPDTSYYQLNGSRVFQWGWSPVGGSQSFDATLTPNSLVALVQIGNVTVATT